MGAKSQKHLGEQGQKRAKKKLDRSKGGRGEGGRGGSNSHGEEGGKRKHLDATTVGYFRRVSERLSEGFTEDEERGKKGFWNPRSCLNTQAPVLGRNAFGSVLIPDPASGLKIN